MYKYKSSLISYTYLDRSKKTYEKIEEEKLSPTVHFLMYDIGNVTFRVTFASELTEWGY